MTHKRIRRLTRRIVIFALVGIVLSIATACGIAFLPEAQRSSPAAETKVSKSTQWLWKPANSATCAYIAAEQKWCSTLRVAISAEMVGVPIRTAFGRESPLLSQEEHALGWPFACLASRRESAIVDAGSSSTTISNCRGFMVGRDFIIIPLRPKWPQLIGNTAVWGTLAYAVFWVSVSSLQYVKRRLRAKDACVRCGYDAHGLPTCPECGTPTHVP